MVFPHSDTKSLPFSTYKNPSTIDKNIEKAPRNIDYTANKTWYQKYLIENIKFFAAYAVHGEILCGFNEDYHKNNHRLNLQGLMNNVSKKYNQKISPRIT